MEPEEINKYIDTHKIKRVVPTKKDADNYIEACRRLKKDKSHDMDSDRVWDILIKCFESYKERDDVPDE